MMNNNLKIERIIKYILLGLVVLVATKYIPENGLPTKELIMISATSDIAMMFEQISEGDGDNLAFYRGFNTTTGFRIYNGADLSSSSLTDDNKTYLFGTTVNNDTGTLYLNGSEDANDYCGERIPAGTYYLGRFEGGSSTTTALKMAEIVIYDRVLTNTERQQVEAYLNTKYAIY